MTTNVYTYSEATMNADMKFSRTFCSPNSIERKSASPTRKNNKLESHVDLLGVMEDCLVALFEMELGSNFYHVE